MSGHSLLAEEKEAGSRHGGKNVFKQLFMLLKFLTGWKLFSTTFPSSSYFNSFNISFCLNWGIVSQKWNWGAHTGNHGDSSTSSLSNHQKTPGTDARHQALCWAQKPRVEIRDSLCTHWKLSLCCCSREDSWGKPVNPKLRNWSQVTDTPLIMTEEDAP